jgi:hypothetical protein
MFSSIIFKLLICNLQMMMFRTRILLGRMGMHDQYQDWRLDVDNMTYEVPDTLNIMQKQKVKWSSSLILFALAATT